eukprot:4400613-Heterocapsa_arctica.AAC.1
MLSSSFILSLFILIMMIIIIILLNALARATISKYLFLIFSTSVILLIAMLHGETGMGDYGKIKASVR